MTKLIIPKLFKMMKRIFLVAIIIFFFTFLQIYWAMGEFSGKASGSCVDCSFFEDAILVSLLTSFFLTILFQPLFFIKNKFIILPIEILLLASAWLFWNYTIFVERESSWSTYLFDEEIRYTISLSFLPILLLTFTTLFILNFKFSLKEKNITMKNLFLLLTFAFALQSCENTTKRNKQTDKIQDSIKRTAIKADGIKIKGNISKIFTDTIEFQCYNDNGDYMWLYAKRANEIYGFVNDNNDQRNLLRGDICEIKWKKDTIYIAGDGETPEIDDWLISIKKTKEGSVSKFRKEYKKELKYHYSDERYSENGLDDLYLLAEYYIANSKNELIKLAIQNKDQLEYSIESRTENNRSYEVLGIGYTFEHRFIIMKWIYIDVETQKIYEYDITNEKLIEFK